MAVLSTYRYKTDVDAFRKYCLETAERYTSLYHWYHMLTSAHIILIHGHEIMRKMKFPIGMLSEEAQESRNKDLKNYREKFSRKSSR